MAHEHSNSSHAPASPADGMAIDPLCGMGVPIAGAKNVAEYDGARHYFCSAHSKTKFVADPEMYHFAMAERAKDPWRPRR